MWTRQILAEIESYESLGNPKIEYIAFCNDSCSDFTDIATPYLQSAASVAFSREAMIHLFSDDTDTFIEMPEEVFGNYFDGRDWKAYCPGEQLVFNSDVLYCVSINR